MNKNILRIPEKLGKLDRQTMILCGLFAIIFVVMYSLNPAYFVSARNFKSMTLQLAENGCFALAYFLVSVCGGFNFACIMIGNVSAVVLVSIASNSSLSAFLSPEAMLLLGVVGALLTGVLCGMLMAFFVSKFNIPPLMVTICASRLFEGIGMFITRGVSAVSPRLLVTLAGTMLWDAVPLLLVITVFCFLLCSVFLRRTKIGEQAQLLGFNKTANRYSGNNNTRVIFVVYMLSGFFSAIGGMMVLGKYAAIQSDYGLALTGQIILIVLLSGMTLSGGDGKVHTIFIALCCIQMLSTGISMGGASTFLTEFIFGALLLAVVVINTKAYRCLRIFRRPERQRS